MAHAKRRGGGHEEEHENHERWAVSYADMMTVLMALFLVLFAMSSIDVKKYDELRTSLAQGFGNQALPTDSGSGIEDGATNSPVDVGADLAPTIVDSSGSSANGSSGSAAGAGAASASGMSANVAGPAVGTGAGDELAARTEAATEEAERARINGALASAGLAGAAQATITERGVVVTVVANNLFFASASAVIEPRGLAVLDAVAPALAATTRQVSVEGHANNLAISSAQYPTNWQLSGARAIAVLLHLTDVDHVAGDRLSALADGDAHPLYANSDPRAVEGNRRVDIVIESDASATVAAEAAALANGGTAAPSSATTTSGN